uniref:Uncharacterized protein n=1 Tax=Plectus sambesii TaxID=2011161 RepID=A0A914WXI2_9BILA
MWTRQSLSALLVLLVVCETVPYCLCVGLRITCPNQQCYGEQDDVRALRQREAALRKLVERMQAKKLERIAAAQWNPPPPVKFDAGPMASSLCFCSSRTNRLTCPWNAAHPSQGLSCDDR